MKLWRPYDLEFVRRRYNRLASFYLLFEWLWLPRGIRQEAVSRLELRPGSRVLEVGCGTGRNFAHLREAVGPEGHIYGVDFSEGMLRKAREICTRQGWGNVTPLLSDATTYRLPERVDGALFSLCYATMPHHAQALAHAWEQLRSGGRLVVLDAKPPDGAFGKLLRPIMVWTSRATVLGNPDERPWEDLRALTDRIEMEERAFGSYFICRGRKASESPSWEAWAQPL